FTPLRANGGGSTTIPGNWTTPSGSSTGTITLVAAPDGTMNAGRATCSGCGPAYTPSPVDRNLTPAVGQWYIAGVGARSQTRKPLMGPLLIEFIGNTTTFAASGNHAAAVSTFIQGDGEWRWYYTAAKVAVTDGASTEFVFELIGANATHTADFYAPVVVQVAPGVLSDNEALEYAVAMRSFPGVASPGDVSMLPMQRFRMSVPGSNFQYLWQGTPTADRTITLPDASSTPAQVIASGPSTMTAGAVTAATCQTAVTTSATNTTTTDA